MQEAGCPWDGPPPALEVMTIYAPEVQIDQAELERRLADYTNSTQFQQSIVDLADYYRAHRLPVPPYEVLRCGEIPEVRKALETMMICEAKGLVCGKEKSNPENTVSTQTCRRCRQIKEPQR